MRRILALAAATLALASCTEAPSGPTARMAPQAAVSANAPIYLVTFKDGVDVTATTAELARTHGLGVRFIRLHAARGFSAVVPPGRAEALRADPRVLLVERDGPVSLVKPIGEKRPGGGGGGEVVPRGINYVGGSGSGVGHTAWIIDTGVDLDHPDLNTSRDCHATFVGRTPDDQNGHGTHVAGIIAAIDNDIGVVGVAAGAYVCSVRVLGPSGTGTWEGVVNGVDYVAGAGASGDVANMSLGGSGENQTLEQAVSEASAKVNFVLAAGNNGEHASNFTPARVNGANIYTISAVGADRCMPSWSNYGMPPVDFAAPGVSILSLYKGGGTATMSGTSMAAPHVAGILLRGSVQRNGTVECGNGIGEPIAHT